AGRRGQSTQPRSPWTPRPAPGRRRAGVTSGSRPQRRRPGRHRSVMRATRPTLAAAALGSLLLATACTTQFGPPQAAGPGPVGLETFDSCDDLLAHLKAEAAERVT